MRKKLWFRRKRYGWGWTPATKEGWGITIVYVAFLIFLGSRLDEHAPLEELLKTFLLPFILATVFLTLVCYKKGEHPQWGWGDDDRE